MVCSVRGCRSKSKSGSGLSFSRLPSGKNDVARREAWLQALNRSGCSVLWSCLVCERHFRPEDWEKVREDGSRKLRTDAVPTLNLLNSQNRSYREPLAEGRPFSDVSNNEIITSRCTVTEVSSPKMLSANVLPIRSDHTYAHMSAKKAHNLSPPLAFNNSQVCLEKNEVPTVVTAAKKPQNVLPPLAFNNSQVSPEKNEVPAMVSTPVKTNCSISVSDFARITPLLLVCGEPASNINVQESEAVSLPVALFPPSFSEIPANISTSQIRTPEDYFNLIPKDDQCCSQLVDRLEEENKLLKKRNTLLAKLHWENSYLKRILKIERKAKERLRKNLAQSKNTLQKIFRLHYIQASRGVGGEAVHIAQPSLWESLL